MKQSEIKTQEIIELEKQTSITAREKARAARWDIDIAIFLFAVLIIVIILLFQDVSIEIVAPVAIFGLAMVWLVGWQRGKQLFRKFYEEELAKLTEKAATQKTVEETIEEQVQKAFLKRY